MADENKPQESQAQGAGPGRTPAPRRRYRRRLSNLSNVRVGLSDVIRDLEEGERDAVTSRVLVYAYSSLAGVIESHQKLVEFEERIAKLEGVLPRGASLGSRRHMTLLEQPANG
jgi:hypothetical protein